MKGVLTLPAHFLTIVPVVVGVVLVVCGFVALATCSCRQQPPLRQPRASKKGRATKRRRPLRHTEGMYQPVRSMAAPTPPRAAPRARRGVEDAAAMARFEQQMIEPELSGCNDFKFSRCGDGDVEAFEVDDEIGPDDSGTSLHLSTLQALEQAGDITYPEEYSVTDHITALTQGAPPMLDVWKSSKKTQKALVSLAAWRERLISGSVLESEWSRVLLRQCMNDPEWRESLSASSVLASE
jgi:hypothetical protein